MPDGPATAHIESQAFGLDATFPSYERNFFFHEEVQRECLGGTKGFAVSAEHAFIFIGGLDAGKICIGSGFDDTHQADGGTDVALGAESFIYDDVWHDRVSLYLDLQ
jgi:hypothetical protein